MIQRLRAMDSRAKIFVVMAIVLVTLAATGYLEARRDVEIEQEEAVEIARPHIDFEPTREQTRLIRQGANLRPVWAVQFSIPVEDGSRDFYRLTTVEVDARNGDVLRVSDDGLGDGVDEGE